MAKGKGRGRDTNIISNRRLPLSYSNIFSSNSIRFPKLIQFEDRRLFNPEGIYAPARSFSKPRHKLVLSVVDRFRGASKVARRRLDFRLLSPLSFEAPKKVLICVRRKQRKEVLHALRKAGKFGQRRPRRSYYSDISCRS